MRRLAFLLAVLSLLGGWGEARGESASLENSIKAAYLPKFAPFIEWPSTAFSSEEAPVVVCIIGADPFAAVLDQAMTGQRLGERAITVRRMEKAERNICHIAYLSGSRSQSVRDGLKILQGTPVLTVTDEARSPGERGAIYFVVQQSRVRFHIDQRAADQNGLGISSHLLNLALTVRARR